METTVIPSGTVVVGVDGSPSSERALDWAVDHAARERRQLTLAHGFDPAGLAGMTGVTATNGRDVLALARERVRERRPDLAVYEVLWPTDARVTLLELSERAALVVVGSRGRGPVRSLLLGSVGVAVTRHASCPVVVVRPGHPGAVRHGVLVGLDASERCRPVLELGYRLASQRDLPLTILHATRAWDPGLDVGEAVAGLAEKFPDVRATTRLVHEDPAFALARESRRMDLVVLGAHHGGVRHSSVTSAVLEHADCAVAVVPPAVGGSAA